MAISMQKYNFFLIQINFISKKPRCQLCNEAL